MVIGPEGDTHTRTLKRLPPAHSAVAACRYDKDSSGQIDYKEFRQATRTDLRVPTKDMVLVGCFAQGGVVEGELMKGQRRKALLMKDAVEDSDLKRLFRMADKKGDGSISYEEFAAFMLKRNPKDTAKGVLQDACMETVTRIGWAALFEQYDTDGGGELDQSEFEAVVRKDLGIGEDQVSAADLSALFQFVDKDSSGRIDADEFLDFLSRQSFLKDMTAEEFAESMFQMAFNFMYMEAARESFADCGTEEERCVRFFEFVYEEVATPQKRLRPLKMRSAHEKKMAVAERYDIDKTDAVDSDAPEVVSAYRDGVLNMKRGKRASTVKVELKKRGGKKKAGSMERQVAAGWDGEAEKDEAVLSEYQRQRDERKQRQEDMKAVEAAIDEERKVQTMLLQQQRQRNAEKQRGELEERRRLLAMQLRARQAEVKERARVRALAAEQEKQRMVKRGNARLSGADSPWIFEEPNEPCVAISGGTVTADVLYGNDYMTSATFERAYIQTHLTKPQGTVPGGIQHHYREPEPEPEPQRREVRVGVPRVPSGGKQRRPTTAPATPFHRHGRKPATIQEGEPERSPRPQTGQPQTPSPRRTSEATRPSTAAPATPRWPPAPPPTPRVSSATPDAQTVSPHRRGGSVFGRGAHLNLALECTPAARGPGKLQPRPSTARPWSARTPTKREAATERSAAWEEPQAASSPRGVAALQRLQRSQYSRGARPSTAPTPRRKPIGLAQRPPTAMDKVPKYMYGKEYRA